MKASNKFHSIPPFEKGGPGGIFLHTRTRKSPSLPLFQRGKWHSGALSISHPSYRCRPVTIFIANTAPPLDAGLRRHDGIGFGAEEK